MATGATGVRMAPGALPSRPPLALVMPPSEGRSPTIREPQRPRPGHASLMVRAPVLVLVSVLLVPVAAGAGLTAGDVDDHLNWDAYLRYLERTGGGQSGQTGQSGLPSLMLSDRITLRVVDENGDPVAFARVEAKDAFSHAVVRWAGSDGL